MANEQISDFVALSAVPAAGDLLAIVDISDTADAATGTTKKITKALVLGLGITTVTDANHTATDEEDVIFFDLSAGNARTLTLEPVANRFRPRCVKNLSSSTADLTIDGDGSETIDGSPTILLAPGDKVWLIKQASGKWETL